MDFSGAFSALFEFLKATAKWCLDAVLWVLTEVLYMLLDGVLTVISTMFKALDFSTFLSTYAMNWAGLPTQMIWFVNAVGIPQGLVIMSAAIGIRMALNLIPAAFTRI